MKGGKGEREEDGRKAGLQDLFSSWSPSCPPFPSLQHSEGIVRGGGVTVSSGDDAVVHQEN